MRTEEDSEELDSIFFSDDFDAELIMKSGRGLGDGDVDEDLEAFEQTLWEENEREAREIEMGISAMGSSGEILSKKQLKIRRIAKLEKMTGDRPLFENVPSREGQPHKRRLPALIANIDTLMGPLTLLAFATKNHRDIEIRIRNHLRVERSFFGVPVAFDAHWNVLVRDAEEVWIPSDRVARQMADWNAKLPDWLQWLPLMTAESRSSRSTARARRRKLPCTLVKGDTIVLIRLLEGGGGENRNATDQESPEAEN